MTERIPSISELNAAISAAILTVGPDAFEFDGEGNPTGYNHRVVSAFLQGEV